VVNLQNAPAIDENPVNSRSEKCQSPPGSLGVIVRKIEIYEFFNFFYDTVPGTLE
jgi:hypothetical protein